MVFSTTAQKEDEESYPDNGAPLDVEEACGGIGESKRVDAAHFISFHFF